jgi:hypothetical protein
MKACVWATANNGARLIQMFRLNEPAPLLFSVLRPQVHNGSRRFSQTGERVFGSDSASS